MESESLHLNALGRVASAAVEDLVARACRQCRHRAAPILCSTGRAGLIEPRTRLPLRVLRRPAPRAEGSVVRDGVRVHYQVFGNDGRRAVLLLPTWSVVHSDFWAKQVPHLARSLRGDHVRRARQRCLRPAGRPRCVLGLGVRGGRSRRARRCRRRGGGRCLAVGRSIAGLILAAGSPERVAASVFIAPGLSLTPPYPERAAANAVFDQPQPATTAG